MAWAQEMKNLAADVKISHKDRAAKISEIKRDTRAILNKADDYMKKVATELREMAKDLKDFLGKSEETRYKDFKAMMGTIQGLIKSIRSDLKTFLAKSEEARMADFKAVMRNVSTTIEGVKKEVKDIKVTVKGMLGNYSEERKEAARYWSGIKGKGSAIMVEEEEDKEKPKSKKAGKKNK